MRSVRIPWEMAQAFARNGGGYTPQYLDGLRAQLREMLRPSPKKAAAKKAKRQRVVTKKATKKGETAAIREAVMARADGRCETCGGEELGLELHHALGRGKAKQAESNCLGVCVSCHRQITRNDPSASFWLQEQANVFRRMKHLRTAWSLENRREFVEAREKLSSAASEAVGA